MKRPPLPKCSCGKIRAIDLDEARKYRALIWAKLGGAPDVRYYECRFGAFHWTRELDPNYHMKEAV